MRLGTAVVQRGSLWWLSEAEELVEDVVRVAKRCHAGRWS